jgi:hypothetical protein
VTSRRLLSNFPLFRSTFPFVLCASSDEKDNSIPPPPPSIGRGEWADWDTDGYVEEPYETEDEPEDDRIPTYDEFKKANEVKNEKAEAEHEDDRIPSYDEFKKANEVKNEKPVSPVEFKIIDQPTSGQWSPLSTGKKGEPMGMSASDNWGDGWSEDAAYFDEDDTQDDEGNWGRSEGSDKPGYGAVSGSSDLWTRQTPDEVVPAVAAVTAVIPSAAAVVSVASAAAAEGSAISSTATPTGSDALTVVLEMNRQFAHMDSKLSAVQSSYERKIDQLLAEVSELKRWLGFIGGSLAVVLLKLLLSP